VKVRAHRPEDAARWDAHVARCPKGTVLHTRRFLAYHGARFEDASLIVQDGERWLAALPAARIGDEVVSHPGATFGGVLVPKHASARAATDALEALLEHLRGQASALRLKLPPSHLSDQPEESDLHTAWRLGGTLERMDLWSVATLGAPMKRDVRSAKKGRLQGVTAAPEDGAAAYVEFHAMLSENLRAQHDVRPVHTEAELLDLRGRLADAQELWVARDADGAMVAGSWLIQHREGAWHTQYLACAEAGRPMRAQDVLMDALVSHFRDEGAQTLSFGACTEDEGRTVNDGLLTFKTKFGGGAVTAATFRFAL